MSFIKQFTDNLLSMEFRTINNMNDNTILSDESKYMGLCKFTGNTMYIVVAINGDNPDYEIITHGLQNFLAMEKRFNVVSLFVYFKEKVDEKIINYCNVDILDYNAPYVELKWVVDILEKKIIVNGQQPNKLIDIEKAINSALNMEGYDVATDVRDLEKKHIENRAKNVKTNNIAFTIGLMAINVIVFFAMELLGGSTNTEVLLNFGALDRDLILSGQIYRLFTYMFLHIGFMHLLCNGFSIYIFGSRAEKYFGKLKYIIIYIISGLLGGLLSITFNGAVSAGASGAIFGIMGANIVYSKFYKRSMDGLDLGVLIVFAIINIGTGILIPNIDNWGHLGGLIGGLITSLIFCIGEKKNETT